MTKLKCNQINVRVCSSYERAHIMFLWSTQIQIGRD